MSSSAIIVNPQSPTPPANGSSQTFSLAEIATHNTEASCWLVVDNQVYDVTKFLKTHPGGKSVLLGLGGKDVSSEFYDFHARDVLEKYGPKMLIGRVEGSSEDIHSLSRQARCELDTVTPFAESSFFRGWKSPYLQDRHKRIKLDVRKILQTKIAPLCDGCDVNNEDPSNEVFLEMGKTGLIAARMGKSVVKFVKELNITLPGGISADELDYFTRYIVNCEFNTNLSPGLADGLGAGVNIGLPPILYFGNKQQRAKYVPPILLGTKRVCLAITEPSGGSDVAGVLTSAEISPDKSHYIVNGVKKWITGGTSADVFVTAVRTGGPGHKGLSFLIIERSNGGVSTSKIKTSYSGAASTALVMFENVKVPKENLIGPENSAFKMIMANFNHERWLIVHTFLGNIRNVVADCYRWSMQRKAFGKRLIDQPVIRYKLAEMSAAVESLEAWTESITYQMEKMDYMEQTVKLAAPIALLKFHTTRTCVMIADNAAQIFGGRGVTRTGMGKRIEEFVRCYKIAAIYGGSEEIMADVAVRQSVAMLDAKIAKGDKNAVVMSRL